MTFTRRAIGSLVFAALLANCVTKKSESSKTTAVGPGPFQGLATEEISQLITKSNGDWNNSETKMAWLTLASNFLNHIDSARQAIQSLSPRQQASALNLGPGAATAEPVIPLATQMEQQRIDMGWAEQSSRSALDQSKLMLDYNRASGDYDIRRQELLKGYDKQNFDNSMTAARAAVENQGLAIENFQKLQEAKKKIIENQILSSYANAFNSYVRAYQDYSANMATIMRGAKKVSQKATVLVESVLEYDKRAKRCASPLTAESNNRMRAAVQNLKLADYSKLMVTAPASVSTRVRAVSDLPSGSECLELGLIQANQEQYPASKESDIYAALSPVFRLYVDPSPKGSVARRTLTACPAVAGGNDVLKIASLTDQVMDISSKISATANSLEMANSSYTFAAQPGPAAGADAAADDSTVTQGERFDADAAFDSSASYLIDTPRNDGREMIAPYPVTPLQLAMVVAQGQIEFKNAPRDLAAKSYCSLRPIDEEGKRNLKAYIDAVRKYEAQREIKLRRDLEVAGVRFDRSGKIEVDSTPFNSGFESSTDRSLANTLVRRGFFLAQQCGQMAVAKIEEAQILPGHTEVTLPKQTDVTVGVNKYSFFYPPYSLGDDESTLGNALVKATRTCVDNALMSLSQSQQSLTAASEFYKFFAEAANIRAPAAPIPYVPNPPPGSIVYGR